MNNWKDLDKDSPLEVLMNMDKYQIQLLIHSKKRWRDTEIDDRSDLFEKINNGFIKYRYRLKPLESMRIDSEIEKILILDDRYTVFNNGDKSWNNRKVEIIGE